MPHEKTDPTVVKRLKGILHPSKKPDEIQKLHEQDESTKWFGVARDLTGRPNFEDYGRYATLMSDISGLESLGNRYPQIVSFIGVTNAGKSTLIKMLVNHDINVMSEEAQRQFPSPVVGSVVNDSLPTSGDVHLYADPATHAEQLPILYADCEGFEGGERTPLGARSRRQARADGTKDEPSKLSNVHARPIQWANTEESRQREYAVTALYPRLLYTFSDCVVFVLRNPKTFQSAVLTKLLDWGVAALEKSINQPALPHCIVALNGSDPGVDDREWDINYATQSLLSSVRGALDYVEGVPRFRELADYWRSLGKHIYTVEDLILRYYSSFKVVRIPARPRYTTINEQIGKLHDVIKKNCDDAFRTKRRARMLTNADELNTYLQSGFDHFTTHLNVPFNFMQISLLRNPIPNDFGGHILQLCTTISAQQPNHQPGRVSWMFEKLSVMLASCVLLDCARFRKGRVDELFSNYEKFFDYAMGEYLELHYPCSFVSPDGTRQCQLVKARHQVKGHQDEEGIICAGDFVAAFDRKFVSGWKSQLKAAIEGIHRDFSYEIEQASQVEDTNAIPEERIALDLHIEYLNQFYETVGPAAAIVSHATCFCCLMDVPEHPLPCGHVLCNACIKAYGKEDRLSISLSCCPMHREATRWAIPAVIKFKPAGAGVRVLALDGGGIRGVVQLEVLRAIEQTLGGYLPVQSFFDLMLGTGTGGMLAVALAMKDRTVDSCLDMFTAMCDHAFTPRMKGMPILNQLVQAIGSGPKYKTKPLHEALKTAFSDTDDLFGCSGSLRNGAKVGLTSTSATGRETILLASYRRPDDYLPAYSFERPHEPDMELKTWESIAGALSNPSYFKTFSFKNKTYQDGGLRCVNPAFIADRERKLIWPDAGQPDLFLSLGTGQNRITVLEKLSGRPKEANPHNVMPKPGQTAEEARRTRKWRSRKPDDILEAEIAWQDFRSYAVHERSEAKGRRFIRFNPDLDREPPAADSKNDLETLQLVVRKRLQTPHRMAALRNVAHRLVASSFYLDVQSKVTGKEGAKNCRAVICCRFEDGSMEMCAMGKILDDKRVDGFEPYFLVKPNVENDDMNFKIPLTLEIVRGMTDNAICALPNIYIPIHDETKATAITMFLASHDGLEPDGFPVSGFPRTIIAEQQPGNPRRQQGPRGSSDQIPRNAFAFNPSAPLSPQHFKNSSDADSISLNGPRNLKPGPGRNNSTVEESWQDTHARISSYAEKTGQPKMSLADLIAQHQGGTSVKGRTNRFWTYIGNTHMAQHPEMYSPDDVAKFANNATVSQLSQSQTLPSELSATPNDERTLVDEGSFYEAKEYSHSFERSKHMTLEAYELEAAVAAASSNQSLDKAARELERTREHPPVYRPSSLPLSQRYMKSSESVETYRPSPNLQHPAERDNSESPHRGFKNRPVSALQEESFDQRRPDSQGRDPVPSTCETVFEGEDSSQRDSLDEAEVFYATAKPVTQVRAPHQQHKQRNTIDSFVGLYSNHSSPERKRGR